MNNQPLEHRINKRYKKTIKKLQTRLNEEQRDAKRLTMLLELCKPYVNDVVLDIITEEIRNMRYRYHFTKWITIDSSDGNP